MPIRIKRDDNQETYSPRTDGGGTRGGGGGLMQFIPLLIGLFGRNPKLLLILAVVGGLWYFMGGKGCSGLSGGDPTAQSGVLATGANFDIQKYASTEIYEPLADNKRNPMPERVSLLDYAPVRRNQGQQGSCVAWASAYSARTIMESRESGQNPNQSTFSPAFLYNQIALEGCQGAYLPEALKVMQNKGLAPYDAMRYNENDCSARPDQMALRKAEDFKIDGYQRLTGGRDGSDPKTVNMLAIKQNLAQGAPVVIGMMVGGSFMQPMMGQDRWRPTDGDYNQQGFGGHAMCVIGYDDYKFGQNMGGFQIMNSWGEEWGSKGVAWVSYDDFEIFVKEAYGIYPGGDASAPQTSVLTAQFGIVLNANDQNLELQPSGTYSFRTSRKMVEKEEFKLQVSNNLACHVYIFGQETDGSSYILFPYTSKHSPYCGIKGTRLFPRDHSYFPDNIGTMDYFAIVVSKDPIDYETFTKNLSTASGSSYEQKLMSLVKNNQGVRTTSGKTIDLQIDFSKTDIAGLVVEVQK